MGRAVACMSMCDGDYAARRRSDKRVADSALCKYAAVSERDDKGHYKPGVRSRQWREGEEGEGCTQ